MRRDPTVVRTLLTEAPRSASGFVALLSVVICAAVSSAYWRNLGEAGDTLAASGRLVFEQGEYWRLFTTIPVHGDAVHLASNAIALAIASYLVYGYFGAAAYPGLAVPAAAGVNVLSLMTYPPEVRLVGASGLVYMLATWWLTSFMLIERQRSIGSRLLRCTGFGLVLLMPSTFDPSVSHRTHAFGAAVGIVAGLIWYATHADQIRDAEVRKEPEPAAPEDREPPGPIGPGSPTLH